MRIAPIVPTLSLLSSLTLVAQNGDPRGAFESSLAGRVVVLKQTLYTLIDWRGTRLRGVTRVSSREGVFYQYDLEHTFVRDTDPKRLVKKLEAEFRAAKPPRLVNYRPKTKLVVGAIRIRDEEGLVELDLQNEFGDTATTLIVTWPERLTPEFTERPQIEALIGRFLEVVESRQ